MSKLPLYVIEDIVTGDEVASIDEKTGRVLWRKVVSTFSRQAPGTIALTLRDEQGHQETIETTVEHPFHVEGWDGRVDGRLASADGKGAVAAARPEWLFPSAGRTPFGDWVRAGALKRGDSVSTMGSIASRSNLIGAMLAGSGNSPKAANDNTLTVAETLRNDTPTRVFNFEVESAQDEITNNYFVGDQGAWVHNAGKKEPYPRKLAALRFINNTRKEAFQRAKLDPGPIKSLAFTAID